MLLLIAGGTNLILQKAFCKQVLEVCIKIWDCFWRLLFYTEFNKNVCVLWLIFVVICTEIIFYMILIIYDIHYFCLICLNGGLNV